MSASTQIEWTDATWNPTVGCSIVSPGCTNCYAMKMAARIERMNPAARHYRGLTQQSKAGPVWTGTVRWPSPIPDQPLRWKKPRRIFVNSMSDLFHDDVPDEVIDKVFAIMALAPQHTFQVLTKRAERMRAYMAGLAETPDRLGAHVDPKDRTTITKVLHKVPLPNVWLGVSVEDQARADERIPHLLATPAAKRFLSCEPLLGPVDLLKWFDPTGACCGGEPEHKCKDCPAAAEWRYSGEVTAESLNEPRLDWVIAGGESGPKARPSHPDWFRALRDQCVEAEVPFFFKQWGAWGPDTGPPTTGRDRIMEGHGPCAAWSRSEQRWTFDENGFSMPLDAGDFEWVYRLGKKAAGATLDGREWREFPA